MTKSRKKMEQKPFRIEIKTILPVENISDVPDFYMGEIISKEMTLPLLREAMNSNKGWNQTDNLKILEHEMPDGKPGIIDNNGRNRNGDDCKCTFTMKTRLEVDHVGHKHAAEIHV